jgi:hypothetical protein
MTPELSLKLAIVESTLGKDIGDLFRGTWDALESIESRLSSMDTNLRYVERAVEDDDDSIEEKVADLALDVSLLKRAIPHQRDW